jgi:hypothetical protein
VKKYLASLGSFPFSGLLFLCCKLSLSKNFCSKQNRGEANYFFFVREWCRHDWLLVVDDSPIVTGAST